MDWADVDPGEASEAIAAAAIATLDWAALANVKPAPKAFVIPWFAPAGEVTLFTGPGSAGKSLLAQQLATALAAGVPTLRLEMGQAPAIYLTCEDDEGQLPLIGCQARAARPSSCWAIQTRRGTATQVLPHG